MGRPWNRRDIVRIGVAAGAASLAPRRSPAVLRSRPAAPLVIASGNGLEAVTTARAAIERGEDTLDAVIAGVNLVELDPEDVSVGYGGLPNADGVVQLDASVMHGPSRRGGGVAAIEGVKTPSKVAQLVAYRTDHVLLVGEGAARFARMHGFEPEELLTDRARRAWLRWKETMSDQDGWLSPEQAGDVVADGFEPFIRSHGTINCNAINAAGEISGVTTTSGRAFKIPGRVGDSPILGAGLYVDNDIGACGSTGRGEANLLECASFLVVERMRAGDHPRDACIAALRRIADKTVAPRLLSSTGTPAFGLQFYALNKAGQYAGASMYGQTGNSVARFAVDDGSGGRLEECAALFDSFPD